MASIQPNYTIRTREMIWIPRVEGRIYPLIKMLTWVILAAVAILSMKFGSKENIKYFALAMIVPMTAVVLFSLYFNKKKQVASPLEIRFYDDYLVIFRKEVHYKQGMDRMETYKFFYSNIQVIQYSERTEEVDFYGLAEYKWYALDADGNPGEKPVKENKSNSILGFFVDLDNPIDWVKEIEEHSPLNVAVEDKNGNLKKGAADPADYEDAEEYEEEDADEYEEEDVEYEDVDVTEPDAEEAKAGHAPTDGKATAASKDN